MINRERIKPFVLGIVSGAAAIAIVASATGWVVTSGSRDDQVQTAWIDGQATICDSLAKAHRHASNDVTDLSGYQGRDARNALAETFTVILAGSETADPNVIKACSEMLKSGNTAT
jgi:hypothetical protein